MPVVMGVVMGVVAWEVVLAGAWGCGHWPDRAVPRPAARWGERGWLDVGG